MKNKRKRRVCAYCGRRRLTDSDHVVAQCLFYRGMLPNNSVLVPACKECHDKKSERDQALRDALVADFSMYGHVAQAKQLPKLIRAYRRNRSIIKADQVRSSKPQDISTRTGIIIGRGYGLKMKHNRVTEAVEWLIRGLYYTYRKKPLGVSCKIKCQRLMPGDDIKAFERLSEKFNMNGPYCMGDTFAFSFAYDAKVPQASVWFLEFYQKVCYWAVTMPPDVSISSTGA